MSDWEEDCVRWRGKELNGSFSHWCPDYDFLPVDETCDEFPCPCTYSMLHEYREQDQKLEQERQRREQAEGLLRKAKFEIGGDVECGPDPESTQGALADRIDKHFGEWDE